MNDFKKRWHFTYMPWAHLKCSSCMPRDSQSPALLDLCSPSMLPASLPTDADEINSLGIVISRYPMTRHFFLKNNQNELFHLNHQNQMQDSPPTPPAAIQHSWLGGFSETIIKGTERCSAAAAVAPSFIFLSCLSKVEQTTYSNSERTRCLKHRNTSRTGQQDNLLQHSSDI